MYFDFIIAFAAILLCWLTYACFIAFVKFRITNVFVDFVVSLSRYLFIGELSCSFVVCIFIYLYILYDMIASIHFDLTIRFRYIMYRDWFLFIVLRWFIIFTPDEKSCWFFRLINTIWTALIELNEQMNAKSNNEKNEYKLNTTVTNELIPTKQKCFQFTRCTQFPIATISQLFLFFDVCVNNIQFICYLLYIKCSNNFYSFFFIF